MLGLHRYKCSVIQHMINLDHWFLVNSHKINALLGVMHCSADVCNGKKGDYKNKSTDFHFLKRRRHCYIKKIENRRLGPGGEKFVKTQLIRLSRYMKIVLLESILLI